MDKFKNLLDKLQKAGTGEGSRGGKVIGHTRSGKPIYASSQNEAHQEFGSGEHRDAMNHHYDIWTKTNEKIAQIRQNNPNWNPPKQIHDFLKHHYTQMQMHQSRMSQAENREKQRGASGAVQAPQQAQESGKKFEPLKYAHMSKSQEITPFYAAVIVVDEKQKCFLLGKRKEDKIWTSPAGGAKVGEMPKAVAIREAFEEANLVLTEEQLVELPMGYAHNYKPVHCFIAILTKEQSKTISVVNDPDKEVKEWEWFPIDEKLPEPMDDNRFTTMTNAKMHLAGIVMKSYYNMDDMEGMTSVNVSEQAVGNSYDSRLKEHIEKIMADYKPGDEPVRISVSNNHVLHLVRIDDGVYSGFVKKNEQDSVDAEVENVLTIDKMTMSDLVGLMKLKGIEPVRTMSSEEVGMAYAEAMDHAGEMIAEQERQSDARAELHRKFPEPQNKNEEDRINRLVDALMGMTVNGDVNIIIQKAKALPVGTVRQWGAYKYVKHNDGWVVIGGEHHGKLMGNFKSDAKYGDYARHHENSTAKQDEPKKKPEAPKEDASGRPSAEDVKRMTQELKDSRKKMSEESKKKVEEDSKAAMAEIDKEAEIKQANELGRAAYDSKITAPVQDKKLMELFAGRKIGDNLHIFDAWIKGKYEAADEAAKKVLQTPAKQNPDETPRPEAPKKEEPKKEDKPQAGSDEPKDGKSEEQDLTPEQEDYVRNNATTVQRALDSGAYKMGLKEWMEAGFEKRRQDILSQNMRPRVSGEELTEERKQQVTEQVDRYMARSKRSINTELKEQHRRYTEVALKAGLNPSEAALKEYPGLGGSDLPEGMNTELNKKTNMIKTVDFGSSSKAIRKALSEHLDTCNQLIHSMNIQFKTPITFRAKGLNKLGKTTRGSYSDALKVIELNDMSAASKTLMHEIGHALDYAMSESERGGKGRHKEMYASGSELGKLYGQLHDVVTQSDYYNSPDISSKHKSYLRTPTEVFARAFEVYSLKKAEDLKLGNDFIDTFVPDVFKTKDTDVEKVRKDLHAAQLEATKAYATGAKEIPDDLQQKIIKLKEEYNKKVSTGRGWTSVAPEKQEEYKMKISELMEQILKEDKIKKALDESNLAITLQKSEVFAKSGLPVGTVRLWGGKKFIKHGDGHWAPLPDNQAQGAQQPQQQAAAPAQQPQVQPKQDEPQKVEEKAGPIDHLKPEKHAGGHISIHSKDFESALKEGPISIISAGVNPNNPEDRALTDSQISERYKRLEQDLKDHGYKYTKVKGHYGGEEDSFIVFHSDEKHMDELGAKYNQDSVIHAKGGKNKLSFTTGDNKGKHHRGESYQDVPDAKDYYSVVNTSDGQQRKFSLGLDFGKLHEGDE